ncbi:MAG: DNA mismatch repair endonuclease MutL [Deltaproteobacteria bacterium]|nr:DNA mismatch repair endonuclease MutL [Deltaproteobacteria bacterium]
MGKGKIKIMPPNIAIKIAAGEVVESPASVVKELIENSIDAGAGNISVYITDGGKGLIRVSDNGEGMDKEGALLAFERHATSKIVKEDDLYSITTMGFRGEALPSIASVSDTVLTTRTRGKIEGTQIRIKGGHVEDIIECGSPDGTTVEVKDIFFNVPARLKFLRSHATEVGNIHDWVIRLSLANPDIRFKLTSGKTVLLDSRQDCDLRERIRDVFGKDVIKEIIPVDYREHGISIKGFVSNTNLSYPTTKGIFIFVNRRWIRNKGVNYALLRAYKNLLMKDRCPFAALFIEIPPQDVDVNIHPAKVEVRFKNPKFIYDTVSDAIKHGLYRHLGSKGETYTRDMQRQWSGDRDSGKTEYLSMPHWNGEVKEYRANYSTDIAADNINLFFKGDFSYNSKIRFDELSFIGQLWEEYILCEDRDQFYIIDQHAAAERVTYEKLKLMYNTSGIKSQMLLVPEMIELSVAEISAIESAFSIIEKAGFEIEPFGSNTVAIKSIPQILSGKGCGSLIKDMAEEIVSMDKTTAVDDVIEAIMVRIACHTVIRGKRVLAREEVNALLKQMSETDFASNCPHGRPAVKKLSRIEIETMFKRR